MTSEWAILDDQAVKIKLDTPYGVRHLFKEALSNMGDNSDASREAGIDPGECVITIEGARVTVKNGGLCIPIEENKEGDLIPMTIFSEMLSGSSLGSKRTSGGAHGIGIKAVGALSSEFSVDIRNAAQHKSFKCTWSQNYSRVDGPHIANYRGRDSSITVSYVLDHKRFGFPGSSFKYTDSDIASFKWLACCLSFTARIPILFQGEMLDHNLNSYANLYTSSNTDRFIVETDNISCIVLDTPSAGKQIGFCNHIVNSSGGVHVKAPLKLIKDCIVASKKDKKNAMPIKLSDIKPHVTVIISVLGLENPEFGGGQMKTSLTAPPVDIDCKSKMLATVLEWGLMRQLDMKTFSKLGAVDADCKRGRHLKIKTGEDATLAGTDQSHLCDLHAVEGESAEGYDSELLDFIPGGRRTVGTFVMRGKLLNVLKAGDKKIQKNRELNELVMRLGLKRVGLDYSDPANRKGLRYGRLVMMADSDEDGNHIRALLLTFFHRFYPSLLENGFVVDYMTPYMRATLGSTTKRFFFEKQFLDWKATVDISKWQCRYYKGLGASETEDIRQDYQNKREVLIEYDAEAPARIQLVMGKGEDATEERKKWMLLRDPDASIVIGRKLPITKFMDFFMRNYSYSTLGRNMKTLADGLTHVARIIIHGTFKVFGRQCSSNKHPKVSDFAGEVGQLSCYHHGDSIQKSVITLAQAFVGSNNLPLLSGKGRFGNIQGGSKHAAAPRYLEVKPSKLLPLIFRQEDDVLLTSNEEEGKQVEPLFFLPIIPLALCNGAHSVCTGWSSEIPNYNPLEIIDQYLARLTGKKFREPVPWYRHYRGSITLDGNAYTCTGVAEMLDNNSFIATCLPIGIWNNKYKKNLDKKLFNDELKDYESECTATKTWFNVTGFKKPLKTAEDSEAAAPVRRRARAPAGNDLTLEDIGIQVTKKLTNLTLLSPEGFPMEWYNVKTLMEDFYQFRLPYYSLRRDTCISQLEQANRDTRDRIAFIQACCSRQLTFERDGESRSREEVLKDIETLGLCSQFYVASKLDKSRGLKPIPLHQLDKQGISKLQEKIRQNQAKIEAIRNTTPEEIWTADLLQLRLAYLTMYPN
ncbi:DNA topoisomerase 2 [uncultured virus]|nr:DNA topoisomerase 2 [uncultured virus]